MMIPGVNVLVYAHHEECDRHEQYHGRLEGLWSSLRPYGVAEAVLSGCLRIAARLKHAPA